MCLPNSPMPAAARAPAIASTPCSRARRSPSSPARRPSPISPPSPPIYPSPSCAPCAVGTTAAPSDASPPSESTFQRALSLVDAARLDQLLGTWLLGSGTTHPHLAVDGKTVKGQQGSLHLFSAFSVQHECVVAQIAIPEKTNEIPQLAALLREVPIAGTLISADALHTQDDTARPLVQARGAEYLLVAKANPPSLRAAGERLFPEPIFSP